MQRKYIHLTLLLFLCSISAQAMRWTKTVPLNAELIEYEIAISPAFKSSQIVDQNYSKTNRLEGDLPQGLYYLRYRDAKNASWSKPTEILLSENVATQFFEPETNSTFESSMKSPVIAFKWKAVGGASSYRIYLRSKSGANKQIDAPGAFARAELGYGTWSAQVGVFFGKKRVYLTKLISFDVVPSTQDAAEFVQPRNDDIVEAYKKHTLELSRTFKVLRSNLEILDLNALNKAPIYLELDPEEDSYTLPPLAPSAYQLTITDFVNKKTTVKSNIKIYSQIDPLEINTRGFKTALDFNLGILSGTAYQKTNTFAPLRAEHRGGVIAPNMELRALSQYWDPYMIEVRAQSMFTEFDTPNGLPFKKTEPRNELLFSASLIYQTNIFAKPNTLLFKAGFFGKQFHQITESEWDNFSGAGAAETPQKYFGLLLGSEFWWPAWSQTWRAKAKIDLLLPVFSKIKNLENYSHSMSPALEITMEFSKYWAEYIFYTITPRIKTERWVAGAPNRSGLALEHYLVSFGLSLGIGIDL